MPRTINVTVSGEFVKKDSKNAGVMGEGNVTTLNIVFDESWSGYGKRIVWRNANGDNPISVILFEPESGQETTLSYNTKIPPEPLEFPGWCSFTFEGYKVSEDGVHAVAMSVSDRLLVNESDSYNKPAEPTPSLAQQVMEALGKTEETTERNVNESKSWAVGGTGFRDGEDTDNSKYYCERSEKAASNSLESSNNSENSKKLAVKAAEEAEKSKQAIFDMSVSAETVSPFDEAKAEKVVTGEKVEIKFSIPQGYSGSTVDASGLYGFHVDENGYLVLSYTGDNPPAFRIDENGDLIYTINDQDVNIGHVVVEGGGGSGTPGKAATIKVGTTTTGEPGTQASVENVGTENAAVLNFTIPAGAIGPTGATPAISVQVTGLPAGSEPTVSVSGTPEAPVIALGIPAGKQGDPGTPGTNGNDGQTPNITIGQVDTLPSGSDATASITGETPDLVLNLGIPKGADGAGLPPTDDVPENYVLTPAGWAELTGGVEKPWVKVQDYTVEGDPVSQVLTPAAAELSGYTEMFARFKSFCVKNTGEKVSDTSAFRPFAEGVSNNYGRISGDIGNGIGTTTDSRSVDVHMFLYAGCIGGWITNSSPSISISGMIVNEKTDFSGLPQLRLANSQGYYYASGTHITVHCR